MKEKKFNKLEKRNFAIAILFAVSKLKEIKKFDFKIVEEKKSLTKTVETRLDRQLLVRGWTFEEKKKVTIDTKKLNKQREKKKWQKSTKTKKKQNYTNKKT